MYKLYTYLSLILLLGAGSTAFAQQYNFRRYSIEEGLPRSGVYCIYEDRDGFLWIGIEGGGVSVFNGETFDTYDATNGLASNTVRVITQDRNGDIWFGTKGGGITRFDGFTFTNFNTTHGLSHNTIRAIVEDNEGHLWVGTFGGGITKIEFDPTNGEIARLTLFNDRNGLPHNKVRSLLKDSKGNIWIGTDGGLCMYDGKNFQPYSTENGLPANRILCLFEDGSKNIWLGTELGAVRFDGTNFITLNEEDGLIQNRVRAIAQDGFGNYWFGTKVGASRYDGSSFHNFNEEHGLSNARIRSMIVDAAGNLWIGTYFGGINKYSGNQFIHYTTKDTLTNDQVLSISPTRDGAMWVGTFEGADLLSIERGEPPVIPQNRAVNSRSGREIRDVVEDAYGYTWFATENGLEVLRGTTLLQFNTDTYLPDNSITTLMEERPGVMWIGTEEGVSRFEYTDGNVSANGIKTYSIADGLLGVNVSTFYQDLSGKIWVGFSDGAITIFENDAFLPSDIPNSPINVIALKADEQGFLWIGTEGNGLYKWNGRELKNYTIEDGLGTNNIYLLEFDDNGNLWVGSERGLSRLIIDDNENLVEVKHFGRDEGFQGIETNPNAIWKDDKGYFWVGTIKGLTVFNPLSQVRNKVEAKTHITTIKLLGEEIDWHQSKFAKDVEGRFHLPTRLTLPYHQNHISFEFIGVSLKIPSKVMYKWKLDGFDDHWSHPSHKHEINYTNLPFGHYTFQVMASNEDGVWNSTPTSFSFDIEPPFWRTTWFYIVCVFVGFGIFFSISQWRVRRLRRAKKNLEDLVDKATEDLRAEKERVEEQHEQIEKQRDRLETTNTELEEKNTSITDSINYAQRIQSAIMQPKSEKSPHLLDRMFVFYRPKDIVSGDFYWYSEVQNRTYVAAADCTGHGVPGAFMSMIGITFLNEIINKKGETHPAQILHQLRTNVIDALQTNDDDHAKDGMDIAFIAIDWDTNTVEFAGAHNPLWVVRKSDEAGAKMIRNGEAIEASLEENGYALFETKSDKMPIGVHDRSSTPFTNNTLQLQPGDTCYLFSDGYVDQFGGTKGKKFLAKRFKKLLLNLQECSIQEQQKPVEKAIEEWMGTQEQVDDILVMGIRL